MSEKTTQDQKATIKDNLEFQLALQRANEETTIHYKDRIEKLTKMHQHELQNLLTAQVSYKKPKLWDRLRGKYKDIYILFNNRMPLRCGHCGEKTKEGVNGGIEEVCLDYESALELCDEFFEKWRDFSGYSFVSLRIVHIQVERKDSRRGAFVRDITLDRKDWNPDVKKKTRKELQKITADKLVVDSLMSMRPRRGRNGR